MSRKSFTVGIVGLGFGRAHIPAFQAHDCEVIALCQRDEAAARVVAERYGVPRVFDRWERMLTEAKPEIVVIATPPALHEAIALAALGAGCHVLCEKPLAMNAAQARSMVERADARGVRHGRGAPVPPRDGLCPLRAAARKRFTSGAIVVLP